MKRRGLLQGLLQEVRRYDSAAVRGPLLCRSIPLHVGLLPGRIRGHHKSISTHPHLRLGGQNEIQGLHHLGGKVQIHGAIYLDTHGKALQDLRQHLVNLLCRQNRCQRFRRILHRHAYCWTAEVASGCGLGGTCDCLQHHGSGVVGAHHMHAVGIGPILSGKIALHLILICRGFEIKAPLGLGGQLAGELLGLLHGHCYLIVTCGSRTTPHGS
mmetsp:Transcript_20260/g.44943  ORF Transcript_20260/g.44943 Transcript_20260/m.44943 type:complete len:213 (+) Transcript_20260:318-956(+)